MRYAIFLVLFIFQQAHCKSSIYAPSIKIPIHLHDLYSSLQKLKNFDFDKHVIQIDLDHRTIPPEVLSKLTLAEISKYLVKHRPHYESLKYIFDEDQIKSNLNKAINHEDLSLFAKWFLKSLEKDFDSIFKTKEVVTYIARKKAKRPLNTTPLRKLHKKLTILLSWHSLLELNGPLIFNNEINKLLPSLLRNILSSQNIFITISHLKVNKKDISLKYFKKMDSAEFTPTKQNKKINAFEKFLDSLPAIIKSPIEGLEIPVQIPSPINDWIPKNNLPDPTILPKKDPQYIPPENLPEPVNDWLMDA